MSDTEQPLRQIDPRQPGQRPLRVVVGIGGVAACLTALASPWLLVRAPQQQTTVDRHETSQDQPRKTTVQSPLRGETSDQAYTPDFERLLPSSLSGVPPDHASEVGMPPPGMPLEIGGGEGSPASAREQGTLVVPPASPPSSNAEEHPEVFVGPSTTVVTRRVDQDIPSNDRAVVKPHDAPSATGSVSVPEPPSRPDFIPRSAKVSYRVPSAPLPKAFKVSTERELLLAPRQRQASLPEPARSPTPTRPTVKSIPVPGRSMSAVPAGRTAQASKTKPLSVVLPNTLLPLGSN